MKSQTPRRFDRRQSLIITFITTVILSCAVLVPVLLSVGSNSSDITRSVEAASIVRSRQVASDFSSERGLHLCYSTGGHVIPHWIVLRSLLLLFGDIERHPKSELDFRG